MPAFIQNIFSSKETIVGDLPTGRSSIPNFEQDLIALQKGLSFLKEDTHKQMIPWIRKLLIVNSSLSMAVLDAVQLCNTGYRIEFNEEVTGEEARKMRLHLEEVSKNWGAGTAGLFGLINKNIFQIFIGGVSSTEWVPKKDLSGVHSMALIRPEEIRVAYNPSTGKFEYYQRVNRINQNQSKTSREPVDLVKLNPLTYKYFELINDLEEPIGIPPFLSALQDLKTQKTILDNIGLVSDQYGLLGFLEVLLKKPGKKEGESDLAYQKRLTTGARMVKDSVMGGLKDGVVVGYKDDHEFDFKSVTKNTTGLNDIFDINHRMVSNGLLSSPAFQGGAVGGSETHINIIFTKMLSQMENIQNIVKANIEYGLWLELTLAKFKFSSVKLVFKESTITDQLKTQQVEEIKIRNNRILYADGIISQDQYAHNMGYEKPDMDEPRVEIDPVKIQTEVAEKKARETGKDASDRKVRDKNKPQPRRKDQSTK